MTNPREHLEVQLERTIAAPPERVYRAWLDPALLARWMAPGPFDLTRAEVDERVGGHYRIWHADAGSGTPMGGFEAEITELVPARRVVFRWGFVGPERSDGPVYDSRLTVTFAAAPGGGTVLTLVHERLDALAAALPEAAASVGAGWADVLDKLSAALTTKVGSGRS
jgi:uncharacterized protein YndB with AHSA1/START domain